TTRSMTRFATNSVGEFIELNLRAIDNSAGRVTAKTIRHLQVRKLTTNRIVERGWDRARCAGRKVKRFRFAVETHETFVELSFALENIRLAHLTLAESVHDWQGDCFLAVSHGVSALIADSFDLI